MDALGEDIGGKQQPAVEHGGIVTDPHLPGRRLGQGAGGAGRGRRIRRSAEASGVPWGGRMGIVGSEPEGWACRAS